MLAATIFKKKPFPPFIKNHRVFKTIKTVKKIFPEIGLANCEKEVEIDNKVAITERAKTLINVIKGHIVYLEKYYKGHSFGVVAAAINNDCITWNNGTVSFNLKKDVVVNGKPMFKKGERLFRVYNKLQTESSKIHRYPILGELERFAEFKEFSAVNIPSANKKFKIVFSSDGVDGLWDMATISMRGITSCQRWDAPESKHLIGTMVDPFTGVIYLTSGSNTSHGSKMIRRCTVKFIVDNKEHPSIGIEKMYPNHDTATMEQFVAFIKEKTNSKFDVLDLYNKGHYNSFIPMSSAVSELSDQNYPYLDSDISYGDDEGNLSRKQVIPIARGIENQVLAAFRSIKLDTVSDKDQKWLKSFHAKTRSNYSRRSLWSEIGGSIYDISTEGSSMTGFLGMCKDDLYDSCVHDIVWGSIDVDRFDGKLANKIAKLAHQNIQSYLKQEIAKLKVSSSKKLPKNAPIYLKYV